MSSLKFYAADLHIHTPSSSCYKGPKDDSEYIKILRRYYDKSIKILAITDHNTIQGYKKIISIKNDISKKIELIGELIKEYPEMKKEIDRLNEEKKLFDEMLILPGIEFEANPGIHLLFIFDPKQDLNKIDQLLTDAGYDQDSQGSENPMNVIVSVEDALNTAKSINALTIGAHVDSNKGIYTDLKGSYRAKIFKSNNLDGISVNSLVTIEKIKNLIQHQEYKREKPLAIIQSSDHHHENDCGKYVTYFQLDENNFDSIKDCFKSPIEKISATERIEIKKVIKKVSNEKSTYCFDKFESDPIYKAISAILNNNFGDILVGVTNDSYKNIKGVDVDDIEIDNIIKDIETHIKPEKIFYSIKVEKYQFGTKRVINFKIRNNSSKKFTFNNTFYSLDKQQIIILDNSKLIEQQIDASNMIINNFHISIDNKINTIMSELELFSDSQIAYDMIQSIYNNSIPLSSIIKLEVVYSSDSRKLKLNNINGKSSGNSFFVHKRTPRTNDTYLRCTCPVADNLEGYDNDKIKKRSGEALVLVSGGGTYIIEEESEWKIFNYDIYNPCLLIKLNDEFSDILCLHTILAWLKSSLFLWMSNFELDTIDLHSPTCFKNIKIPTVLFKSEHQSILKDRIDSIIDLEKKYLSYEFKDIESEFVPVTTKHNNSTNNFASEVDQIIYNSLEMEEEHIDLVDKFLYLKQLHNFTDVDIEEEQN